MKNVDDAKAVIGYVNDREVLVNGKRRQYVNGEIEITSDDLINAYLTGFNRMHEKLALILKTSGGPKTAPLDELLVFIANSSLTRLSHIEQLANIPRYVAKQIFAELVKSKACIMTNGALKKTRDYMEISKDFVVRAAGNSRKVKFELPPEYVAVPGSKEIPLVERSLQDLLELRELAQNNGAKEHLSTIDKHIAEKRQERKEKENERIETIMRERKISRVAAEIVMQNEDEERENAQAQTEEGGDIKVDERYSDDAESEREIEEREEKERTQRKKKKAMKKRNKGA